MKREVKKTFDQIRFVTDYKRDGLMKDYLKGIVYQELWFISVDFRISKSEQSKKR
jgi:hypothetical protein